MNAPAPTEAALTLKELGEPALAFVAVGSPAPQGSKKGIVRGKKAVLIESSAAVAPWRATVAYAARAAAGPAFVALDGPLVVDFVFSMPRPKSAPKTRRVLPATIPDLSKLVRSTEDALGVDARVIVDDARIVEYRRLVEVYEGDDVDPDALPHPGVVVRLWRHPVGSGK